MLRVIFSLVLGSLIGGLVVRAFFAGPSTSGVAATDAPRPAVATDSLGAQPSTSRVEAPSDRAVQPRAASERPAEDVLITAALRRHAEAGIRKGWAELRHDEPSEQDMSGGLREYEKLVLESPLGIGRALAERRTKAEHSLEDAKSGGVFKLLESLDAGGVGPLPEVVRDADRFAALFQRTVHESTASGLSDREHPDKSIEDGVTLSWPSGVFRLKGLMQDKDPFPRDVTIAGAGMNATLLVLQDDWSTRGQLRNFAVRDCTIHTNGNYLFDLRLSPAAIRFERARFVGFDMGAGASCLLGTKSLALWARNCRFEGGYGRMTSSGTLFDVRTDALLARFEFCTVSLLSLHASRIRAGASVAFVGCALEQMIDDPVADSAGRDGIVFDGCTITTRPEKWENVPQLDLNELFPNWQTRME